MTNFDFRETTSGHATEAKTAPTEPATPAASPTRERTNLKTDFATTGKFREARREREVPLNSGNFQLNSTLNAFHHDAAAELNREKLRRLKLRRRRLGVLLLVVAGLVVLGALALSQFSGSFAGVTSNAPNLSVEASAKYQKIVSDYFAKNPFERFAPARRDQALTDFVTAVAPEVSAVKIGSGGFAKGDLGLTFRRPVAQWVAGGATSYVDATGAVFAVNYFAAPSVAIADDSGVAPDGGVATSARFLSFVGQVTSALGQAGETVAKVVIPRGAVRYVEFYLTSRNYPFRAQIDRDSNSQAADIAAMAKYLDAHQIAPQYVDCRVAGKSFWK